MSSDEAGHCEWICLWTKVRQSAFSVNESPLSMPRSPTLQIQIPSSLPPRSTGTCRIPPYAVLLTQPLPSTDKAVAALRTHPSTLKYLRFLPSDVSEEEIRKETEGAENGDTRYLFNVFIDGVFGGISGLNRIDLLNSSCHAGLILAEEFHGSGLATVTLYLLFKFAFEELGLHRVVLETGEDNLSMRGWLENVAGIRQEGIMKEAWKDPGDRWTDMLSYAVLDSEWMNTVKKRLVTKIGI